MSHPDAALTALAIPVPAAPLPPDLYAMVLQLEHDASAAVTTETNALAHAAFLDLIRRADPDLSALMHEGSQRRPFTVSMAPSGRAVPGGPAESPRLRLALLGRAFFEPLRSTFLRPTLPRIRLGAQHFSIGRLLLSGDSDSDAGSSSFAQLLDTATPASRITLRFLSPTAFSLGQRDWGRPMAVVPTPDLVFDSLWRKWNTFCPPHLKMDPAVRTAAQTNAVLTDFNGRTAEMPYPKSPVRGFVGTCTYDLKGRLSADVLRALNTLADFSFFAGVGYKTTMGMGQVRRMS